MDLSDLSEPSDLSAGPLRGYRSPYSTALPSPRRKLGETPTRLGARRPRLAGWWGTRYRVQVDRVTVRVAGGDRVRGGGFLCREIAARPGPAAPHFASVFRATGAETPACGASVPSCRGRAELPTATPDLASTDARSLGRPLRA